MAKCYSTNQEEFYEAELDDFAQDYVDTNEVDGVFSIWEGDVEQHNARYYARHAVNHISELMQEAANERGCDHAADWEPFSANKMNEFEKEFLKLIDKYATPPDFFNAKNIRELKFFCDDNNDVHPVTA